MTGLLSLAGAFLLLQAAACQTRQPEPDPVPCTPTSNRVSLQIPVEQLAGTHRLKLVATRGSKAGQSTDGTLQLQALDTALRAVTIAGIRDTAASYVLYGTAEAELEAVGAVRPGDLESTDPRKPGVLVITRKGGITVRFGSEANTRDQLRYDGGYTVLRVADASDDRFAGSWASGVGTQRSEGYFCAVREDGKDGKDGKEGG